MRILHSIPSLVPESGGTARSVTALCSALAENKLDIELITLDLGAKFGTPILPTSASVHTTFVRNRLAIGQRQLWSPHFGQILRSLLETKEVDLVHDHCIWLPTNLAAAHESRRAKIPFVVSTRGMLEPWALNHNRLRKQMMWHLYQSHTLKRSDLLHATALSEASHLRELGLKTPIAVIPNAVEVPSDQTDVTCTLERGTRTILFLSRIHPKKGLLNLVRALSQVRIDGWKVLIVGPDEGGHLQDVQNAVKAEKLLRHVEFVGSIDDGAKWHYYRSADLFVLPSFSENFGIVVAEALACGVPVITTTGTPWQELQSTQSGWWVEPTVEALVNALQDAISISDEKRRQMGSRGRQLIQQHYSWEIVGAKMVAVYQWLLGLNAMPNCVYL